jgi:Fe-Mn family superoxide dismutase
MNAVYLHELYLANIGDVASEILQDNLSFMRLARDFGTFDDWQRDFMACAMSAREGWAVCGYSTYLRRYVNFVIDSHDSHVPMGVYPVVAIDVWSHSMPLGTDRRAYVISMMRELNWEVIDNRFKRADRIAEALK